MSGNEYGGNNSTSPKCGKWSIFANQVIYGFQPSPVVLCMQTATLALELLVSKGPSPHLCVFYIQNSDFMTRLTSVCGSQTSSVVLSIHNSVLRARIKRQYGFQPSPVVLCMQTATLALETLVSIVPCPYLRFLHANQRLLDQNNKSLWVQDLTCRFVHA